MFIVELSTRTGPVRENYETYAEAKRRIDHFPADSLIGLACIFEELADGSERLVREDGKPLQFHRLLVEESQECLDDDSPLPVSEDSGGLADPDGKLRLIDRRNGEDGWDELPLVQ